MPPSCCIYCFYQLLLLPLSRFFSTATAWYCYCCLHVLFTATANYCYSQLHVVTTATTNYCFCRFQFLSTATAKYCYCYLHFFLLLLQITASDSLTFYLLILPIADAPQDFFANTLGCKGYQLLITHKHQCIIPTFDLFLYIS